MREKDDMLSALRIEAEKLLHGKVSRKKYHDNEKDELTQLLHEIQVYQVELEMQNDELKLSQVELERERSRFVNLFDLAPVGYFVLDHAAVIDQCNDNALSLLDADRSAVIDRRFQSFVDPQDGGEFHLFIRRLLNNKTNASCQLKLRKAGGKTFYAQLQGTAIQESEARASRFYLGVIDITEKKTAELEQKEVYERLQMALIASSAGTWKVDLKSGFIFMDDFAASIFGMEPGQFDGKYPTLLNYIHPEDRNQFDHLFRSLAGQPAEFNYEFRIMTKGAVRYLEARGHVARNKIQIAIGTEDSYIGIVTNVTKRKVMELESIELKSDQQKKILKAVIDTQEQERLRISNALHDSVGQLLYGTSLKLQHAQSVHDKSFKEAGKLIDQAIREARDISFELAPSILTDFGLTVAVPEMVKRIVSKNLSINTQFSGLEKRLQLTSETFIFRIIQELVNNILKHSGATEGTVDVKYRKNDITIQVKDNGTGFSTKEKKTNGTGLYSIKNRIALYNGTLRISSKNEKGTTINIRLFGIE